MTTQVLSSVRSDLRCPRCEAIGLEQESNHYRCLGCNSLFPVVNGVARFVPNEFYSQSFGFQWNRFARTQLDSANGTTRSRDTFLQKTGWTLGELAGRRVLDAGCGMGRFAEICADAGAEIHAIDLSTAVEAAARNFGGRPNVHLYQADIMRLPFAPGTFDYVYSIGVLHHTPNTRKAFLNLAPLVKPGGRISIWVYSKKLRVFLGSEVLRIVTPRLPKKVLLAASRIAIPLYYLHRLPFVGFVTRICFPTSMEARPEWRWLDTFDWYSPMYQWKHSQTEVEGWFHEAGLVDLCPGPFPVTVGARKPA